MRTDKAALYAYWHIWQQRPHHFVRALNVLGMRADVWAYVDKRKWATGPPVGRPNRLFSRSRFHGNRIFARLNERIRQRVVDDFAADRAAIHVYGTIPGLPKRKPPFLVYDCLDEWSDLCAPEEQSRVSEAEKAICRRAGSDWVVSQALFNKFTPRFADKVRLVPNGVDPEFFSEVPSLREVSLKKRGPVLCYIGALHSWFDAPLVGAVARLLPDWHILLVGPSHLSPRQLESLSEPNIQLAGRKPYDSLPGILALADVCMIPFVLNDLVVATSPIKLYEYLAAGLPVVSTPMPEVIAHAEPGVVACADSPAEFAEQVRTIALSDNAARRMEVARARTWRDIFKRALQDTGRFPGLGSVCQR